MKKTLILFPFVILFLFSCASSADKKTGADDSSSLYGVVKDIATAKSRAVDAMNKAKSVKADVAVKDDYNKALGVFNDAEKDASNPSNELAVINKYLDAEKLFLAAYDSAKAKRDEAQKQINKAKEDINRVESEAEAFEKEQKEGATNR